jgi:hypothetical protein
MKNLIDSTVKCIHRICGQTQLCLYRFVNPLAPEFFLILAHIVNNTGTKKGSIMKQTAF